MADQSIEVTSRESTGKNESRRLRKQGKVPAVLYGEKKDPVALAIDLRVLDRLLHSKMGINTVFDIMLTGTDQKRSVMVKEYQLHPVTDRLIHADLIRIDATHEVHVPVHVDLQGVPVGVKMEGGLLEFTTREILVSCLPQDIPQSLPVDVTELHVGQVLRVSDVKLPDGVKALTDPAHVVCAVHTPKAEAAPVAAEVVPVAGAAATPAATEAAPAAGGKAPAAGGKAPAGKGDAPKGGGKGDAPKGDAKK
jgi:large subunit ribosomal protein L25